MKKMTEIASVVAFTSALAVTACDSDRRRDLDRPGEAIEEGTNDMGRSVEDAADNVGDSAEDIAN